MRNSDHPMHDHKNFPIGMTTDIFNKNYVSPTTINLPKLMETKLLIYGTSGAGKSNDLYKICEELSGFVQIIVLDPEGDFPPLRSKYPFVLAGPQGETPAHPRSAAMLAHRLLELGVSAICDLYELKNHERHEFVANFLNAMVDAPKKLWHPVLIILDEAHMFAPEKGQGESVALGAVTDMATRGRKRGFCLALATQRLAQLSKTIAAMCQNVMVGRTSQIDQKRAAETLHITGKAQLDFFKQVTQLPTGEFFAYGMAFNYDVPTLTRVSKAETLPARSNKKLVSKVPPTPKAIAKLLPQLADIPQEVEKKQATEKELREEIRNLKQQLASALKSQQGSADVQQLKDELKAAHDALVKAAVTVTEYHKVLQAIIPHAEAVVKLLREMSNIPEPKPTLVKKTKTAAVVEMSVNRKPGFMHEALNKPMPKSMQEAAQAVLDEVRLQKADRAILTVLAQHGSVNKRKAAALSGYSVNGGAFKNALGRLRSAGYVKPGDPIVLTDIGSTALGGYEELPTGGELLARWLGQLQKCDREILSYLAEHPGNNTKSAVAEATGYEANGGAFKNALGRLRTLELVTRGSSEISLTDEFAEAIQ